MTNPQQAAFQDEWSGLCYGRLDEVWEPKPHAGVTSGMRFSVWTRHFRHASVYIDILERQAVIDWKQDRSD